MIALVATATTIVPLCGRRTTSFSAITEAGGSASRTRATTQSAIGISKKVMPPGQQEARLRYVRVFWSLRDEPTGKVCWLGKTCRPGDDPTYLRAFVARLGASGSLKNVAGSMKPPGTRTLK
jgi:hypothetical protein